jgi:hypothetical protein
MAMFSETFLLLYSVSRDPFNYYSGGYEMLPPLSIDTYWRLGLNSEWNRPAILHTCQCTSGEVLRFWLYCRLAVVLLLFSENKLYWRKQQHIWPVYITANTSNALRNAMFVVYERTYLKKMFFLRRREIPYSVPKFLRHVFIDII